MSSKFFSLLVLVLVFFSCSTIYEYPEEINFLDNQNWKLTWEENFNDSINYRYWSKIPRTKKDLIWQRYMTSHDSCYSIKDGNLILRGVNNNFLPSDTASYLTGGIWSKGKKTFTYGRIEIRAKIGKAKGAWPAIWMFSENSPVYGEIDIMESINHDNYIFQTLHSSHTIQNQLSNNQASSSVNDKTEYNIYGVIINENEVIFYVNQHITYIYEKDSSISETQFPYGNEKFLILSMQLENLGWSGKVDPNELPVEMGIDWVRYYEKIDKTLPDY